MAKDLTSLFAQVGGATTISADSPYYFIKVNYHVQCHWPATL